MIQKMVSNFPSPSEINIIHLQAVGNYKKTDGPFEANKSSILVLRGKIAGFGA